MLHFVSGNVYRDKERERNERSVLERVVNEFQASRIL